MRRAMLVLLFPVTLGIMALVATFGPTFADPNLTNVNPHRHYVELADGTRREVGPSVCDNPKLQNAFNQFHNNVHAVSTSGIGPVAPGLHNGIQAELKAGPC